MDERVEIQKKQTKRLIDGILEEQRKQLKKFRDSILEEPIKIFKDNYIYNIVKTFRKNLIIPNNFISPLLNTMNLEHENNNCQEDKNKEIIAKSSKKKDIYELDYIF